MGSVLLASERNTVCVCVAQEEDKKLDTAIVVFLDQPCSGDIVHQIGTRAITLKTILRSLARNPESDHILRKVSVPVTWLAGYLPAQHSVDTFICLKAVDLLSGIRC